MVTFTKQINIPPCRVTKAFLLQLEELVNIHVPRQAGWKDESWSFRVQRVELAFTTNETQQAERIQDLVNADRLPDNIVSISLTAWLDSDDNSNLVMFRMTCRLQKAYYHRGYVEVSADGNASRAVVLDVSSRIEQLIEQISRNAIAVRIPEGVITISMTILLGFPLAVLPIILALWSRAEAGSRLPAIGLLVASACVYFASIVLVVLKHAAIKLEPWTVFDSKQADRNSLRYARVKSMVLWPIGFLWAVAVGLAVDYMARFLP
ncbi:MAG: hypothetical protein JJU33_11670 [Phycisphaerales bacterium]|nr:hypothetical protein [Phycisphaerales bacterium]